MWEMYEIVRRHIIIFMIIFQRHENIVHQKISSYILRVIVSYIEHVHMRNKIKMWGKWCLQLKQRVEVVFGIKKVDSIASSMLCWFSTFRRALLHIKHKKITNFFSLHRFSMESDDAYIFPFFRETQLSQRGREDLRKLKTRDSMKT